MTKIEWVKGSDGIQGKTWNPLAGCSILSPGCTNCYAMKMAARIEACNAGLRPGHGGAPHYAGTTKIVNGQAVWTGKIGIASDEVLLKPLHRKKPTTYFVNSMSDLFHEGVPDEVIDRIFAVMALTPQHTYQCLTKRSDRMRRYCTAADVSHRIAKAIDAVLVDADHDPIEKWASIPGFAEYEASTHGRIRRDGNILKPQINEQVGGRPSVTLWQDNVPSTEWVHTLVLLAHRGKGSEGEEACHRNGNSQDNRLTNLRWGTRSENQQEKVRHGSNGGPAKLSREQAAEIRAAVANGETQQSVADRFGVSRSLISMIKDRKVWPDAIAWPLPNVWLGVSTERQKEADARIPDLLATPAAIRFISAEPLLGPISLRWASWDNWKDTEAKRRPTVDHLDGARMLDWVIVGGENGPRPMNPDWARSLRDQCAEAGVPFFFKQHGTHIPDEEREGRYRRVPKSIAGRTLDGRTHDEMPRR